MHAEDGIGHTQIDVLPFSRLLPVYHRSQNRHHHVIGTSCDIGHLKSERNRSGILPAAGFA